MFQTRKVSDRESTKEVLERLKSQEKKISTSSIRVDDIPYLDLDAKRSHCNVTIPEYNIEQIMRQITAMERRMKEDSSNYLNLFYDLRKLEGKFLNAVDFISKNNIKVKPEILKEIKAREEVISRRTKRSDV